MPFNVLSEPFPDKHNAKTADKGEKKSQDALPVYRPVLREATRNEDPLKGSKLGKNKQDSQDKVKI